MTSRRIKSVKLDSLDQLFEKKEKKEEEENIDEISGEIKLKDYNSFDIKEWLFLGSNDGEMKYMERTAASDKNIKWGQLKLFVEELLTICYYNDKIVEKIVYVGAMEGTHIVYLSKLFPSINFDLYDKEGMGGDNRKFDKDLKKCENVKIFNKYFEDSDIRKYLRENPNNNTKLSHKTNILFISDIRRIDMSEFKNEKDKESSKQAEDLVWEDMLLQQHWVEVLQPYVSSLKFRLPYSLDFELEKEKTRKYLDGLLMRQVYESKTSSEFRLIVKGIAYRDWDIYSYERKCAYHNYITRRAKFYNIFNNSKKPYSEDNNILLDYDSTVFMLSIKNYLISIDIYPTQEKCIILAKDIIKFLGKGKKDLFTEKMKDIRT